MKVKKEMESEEREVGQLVKSMDDLYRISNLLSERLREWRGMEMDGKELASKIIEELGINDEKKATKSLATILLEVYSVMDEIEDRIHEKMMKIAPNVSQLVGATLGARLISLAGGLRKLAMMPSSTVQLLGAERALFRHLKDGSPSPKHGIIFQHELINRSPREKRGKIARALAAKISIAAKADAFTKGKVAKKLKKELDERMKEINAI
jgi:nucleolar protein 56